MKGLLKALWISARPAVIPSVFSNLLLGWCLGGGFSGQYTVYWDGFLPVVLGGVCFYLFGMWGNDFMDADWDVRNRSDRPIPQGLIGRKILGLCTLAVLVAGLACAHSVEALALVLASFLYNVAHKYWAGSALFMGACRGLLVLMAAGVVPGEGSVLLWPAAIGLACYVAALTWWAREENRFPERIPKVGMFLGAIPLWDTIWLCVAGMYIPGLVTAMFFLLGKWLRRRGARAS